MDPIGRSLSKEKYLNPIANSTSKGRRPSAAEVDAIAREVVATFGTESYYKWYCQLCYKLGTGKVIELLHRSQSDGVNNPGRLFSSLVKQEEDYHDASRSLN